MGTPRDVFGAALRGPTDGELADEHCDTAYNIKVLKVSTGTAERSRGKGKMDERRSEQRLLCSDLISVTWIKHRGSRATITANLENVSASGACIQVDTPIRKGAILELVHGKHRLRGKVRYCLFQQIGYYVGVQFEPGVKWSERRYKPKHLLDPRTVQPKGGANCPAS